MEGYQTEAQQLAVIKEFWQKKKVFVLAFMLILLAALSGNYMLRQHEAKKAEQASNIYQDLLLAVQNVDLAKAKVQGALLLKDYERTHYAPLGAMILAKIAFDEKDFPLAIDKLRYVVNNNNSKKSPLSHVAQVKLARVLYGQGDHKAALKELDNPPNGYLPLYEELKGDIYLSLNDLDKAREAYKTAISGSNGSPVPWLEMKLNNINTVEDALTKGAVNGANNTANA